MELDGNSNSGTSVAFLRQLRERHSGPLNVIWDNAPAHRGEAMREYLRTPGLGMRLVNPRFHEGRLCRATARTSTPMRQSGAGRERRPLAICAWEARRRWRRGSGKFLSGLTTRKDEVKRRCRTVLQSRAETFLRDSRPTPNTQQMHIPPWLWFRSAHYSTHCGGSAFGALHCLLAKLYSLDRRGYIGTMGSEGWAVRHQLCPKALAGKGKTELLVSRKSSCLGLTSRSESNSVRLT